MTDSSSLLLLLFFIYCPIVAITLCCIFMSTRVAFYVSGFGNPSVAICQLTAVLQSLTFLRLYVLRTFWHMSAIFVIYSNLKDSFRPKKKMELNREHFRGIIFYNFRRGLTQQQCNDGLNSIFGDEDPSRTSVSRWYGEFNWGRSSLQDEFREESSKINCCSGNHWCSERQLILQNRHVTYREMEITLGISGTSIQAIFQD